MGVDGDLFLVKIVLEVNQQFLGLVFAQQDIDFVSFGNFNVIVGSHDPETSIDLRLVAFNSFLEGFLVSQH